MRTLTELTPELQKIVDAYYLGTNNDAIQQIQEMGYVVETELDEIISISEPETAEEIFSGLNFSTQFINSNWRIKVNGHKLNKAVGVSGLIKLVGIELANKLFNRAFNGRTDKTICKLRRGLKVTFYAK